MTTHRYLIVDTETTGLPVTPRFGQWHPPHLLEHYNGARIVQIAWAQVDAQFEASERGCVLIKPRMIEGQGYEFIHDGVASRINGISHDQLLREGIDIGVALDQLLSMLKQGVTHFVAHNAGFDINILRSECHRAHRSDVLAALDQLTVVCTMQETRLQVNLPGKYGPKAPKLIELFHYCYGHSAPLPGDAHRADTDVEILRLCLVKLKEKHVSQNDPTIKCSATTIVSDPLPPVQLLAALPFRPT